MNEGMNEWIQGTKWIYMFCHVTRISFKKVWLTWEFWLYNKATVNIKKWKMYKPFKIKFYSSELCIVLNSWIFILLIRWHAGESYKLYTLLHYALVFYIIISHFIVSFVLM